MAHDRRVSVPVKKQTEKAHDYLRRGEATHIKYSMTCRPQVDWSVFRGALDSASHSAMRKGIARGRLGIEPTGVPPT